MTQNTTKPVVGFRRFLILLIILLLAIFQLQLALAVPVSDSSQAVPAAAMKLVVFGTDSKAGLDVQAVATLVDYVLGSKPNKETDLPAVHKASVAVYVETGSSPSMVRTGIFQWVRAGWSGVNFVETQHIIKSIKRYAKNSKSILESPNLPAPNQIASAYQRLSSLPHSDLLGKYVALQQARRSLAVQSGKIETNKIKRQDSYAGTPKEQIVEELMLEYLKVALGKPSLLGGKVI